MISQDNAVFFFYHFSDYFSDKTIQIETVKDISRHYFFYFSSALNVVFVYLFCLKVLLK